MKEARTLTVSELSSLLNTTLEGNFPQISFGGEISEFARAASGHCYFTIKDERAQLSCVMWNSASKQLKFAPGPGVEVRCFGKPNIYLVSGRLQIVVARMEQAGEGLLQKRFLELKAKLEREGLFAEERKRPIPFFPRRVGIVTSAKGAVIHDIMVRFRERMPHLEVVLVDVRVQGEGAADEIASGIRLLNAMGSFDVLIVGRGGGSLEDLWAFNEEVVVRAIFASATPVVSAVGHEVDNSLADLVADVRAPTPTAAAEMVVPHRLELLGFVNELERRLLDSDRWLNPRAQQLDELERRLTKSLGSLLTQCSLRVRNAELMLKRLEPGEILTRLFARVDELDGRLTYLVRGKLEQASGRVEALRSRLSSHTTGSVLVEPRQVRVEFLGPRLQSAIARLLQARSEQLVHIERRLVGVDPKQVVKRGYAIVRRDKMIVTTVGGLAPAQSVNVMMSDGSFDASVGVITNETI